MEAWVASAGIMGGAWVASAGIELGLCRGYENTHLIPLHQIARRLD